MTNPFVKKLEGVASLSGEERRVLADAALRTRTVGPDQDVVREGDRPTECSLILDGVLCRYKLLPEGRRQIIGFQIPGDLCDLTGFVLGRMDHSVATLTAVKLAVISHKRLEEIAEQCPRLARGALAGDHHRRLDLPRVAGESRSALGLPAGRASPVRDGLSSRGRRPGTERHVRMTPWV